MAAGLHQFLAGLADGVVDAQLELDERGRDSIDAFEQIGVPPTVLTWSGIRLLIPVAVALVPKSAAGEVSEARLSPRRGASLALRLRYHLSPQGVDDPRPLAAGVDREAGRS
jgi:hypothetical protein